MIHKAWSVEYPLISKRSFFEPLFFSGLERKGLFMLELLLSYNSEVFLVVTYYFKHFKIVIHVTTKLSFNCHIAFHLKSFSLHNLLTYPNSFLFVIICIKH
jgi:hypothetical protein